MARRAIRENNVKDILSNNWYDYFGESFIYNFKSVKITPKTDFDKMEKIYGWLNELPLVVKPDMLFGKRGVLGLVLYKKKAPGDVNWEDVKKWITEKRSKTIEIKGQPGRLTHFIVEPFIAHDEEYFIAITMGSDEDTIYISSHGGIDIEDNWDLVTKMLIPATAISDKAEKIIYECMPKDIKNRSKFGDFTTRLYKFFRDLHFTYLEINPLAMTENTIFPLDFVARIDDTAQFLVGKKWGDVEFPVGFGRELTSEEKKIKKMDENSGASLKLTVLNTDGDVWTMVAGGGASVVYADTVADFGYSKEIANYGEYSGNPTRSETKEYASTILELMTRNKSKRHKSKILIIGGAIANFTDISKTFDGIIDAMREYSEKMKSVNTQIFVRRGGPNYQEGLSKIEEAAKSMNIPIQIFGPEHHMTSTVKIALSQFEN